MSSARTPEFIPDLLYKSKSSSHSTPELRLANKLLKEAMAPVEVPQARQGDLPEVSEARAVVRKRVGSSFSSLANAVFEASNKVAACVDLHELFRDVRIYGEKLMDSFPRLEGDNRKTKVTLFMLDPFDDLMLRTEPEDLSVEVGRGIVGHVAKSGRVLNLAIAEMAGHPTNHLNDAVGSKRPDNSVDPDEFWMSYTDDPTKDVLAVPVFEIQDEGGAKAESDKESCEVQTQNSPTGLFHLASAAGKTESLCISESGRIVGVLLAERPSIRAHFRRQRSRQGKRRGGRRSRGSSREQSERPNIKPSPKERAQNAPYSPGLEEALCQLARIVSAAIKQANNDAGNSFADQARRFREKKNMTRVFKTFERIARAAQNRRIVAAKEESENLRARIDLLSKALEAADTRAAENRKRLAEMDEARQEAELQRKRYEKESDMLKAKNRGIQSELSRCKAAMLQGERRLQHLQDAFKDRHHPNDVREIESLQKQVCSLKKDLLDTMNEAQQLNVKRVLTRIAMRHQSMAFHAWHAHADAMRLQKQRMRRLMARMLNRLLGTTFDAWCIYVEEEQRMRALLRRAAVKMKNRALASSWNSFLEYVELRIWLRRFCQKMIARFEKKELASGFGKWKSEYLRELQFEQQDSEYSARRRSRFCTIQ